MIHIEPLQPADWTMAMELALADAPEDERAAQLSHCLNLLAEGVLDPRAIRVARRDHDKILGVQVCVPLAGATCLFWLPVGPDEVAESLVRACLDWCRTQGIKIAQVFATMEELPFTKPLLRQGFRHTTRMQQLRHALLDLPAPTPSSLHLVPFQTSGYQSFTDTLQRTYKDTLDCPELNGRRTMAEIIAGHQAEGRFDPARWWLACEADQPVGVVMLAELLDGLTWDLAYLGIVPEHRGRGHGRWLLQHALRMARQGFATRLIVSVDTRNTPAVRLYQSVGFVESATHEVLLQFLS